MIKYECDRCGNPLGSENDFRYPVINYPTSLPVAAMYPVLAVCQKCATEIMAFAQKKIER